MAIIPTIIVGMPTMVDIVAITSIMAMVTAVTTTIHIITTDMADMDMVEEGAREQVSRRDAQAIIVDRQPS